MKELLVASDDIMLVIEHCRQAAPMEACGLLLGTGALVRRVRPLRNVEESPRRFYADPDDQIAAFLEMERERLNLLAIYHSHPSGPPYPSHIDLRQAYYPDALCLIVSGPRWPHDPCDQGIGLFSLAGSRISPASLVIAGGRCGNRGEGSMGAGGT